MLSLVAHKSVAEENAFPSYSPASFDFDTIYSMFPARNAANPNLQCSGEALFDSNIPDDPLFGLMDESMLSFADVTDTFFNGTSEFGLPATQHQQVPIHSYVATTGAR
jgi:hypothetical protein